MICCYRKCAPEISPSVFVSRTKVPGQESRSDFLSSRVHTGVLIDSMLLYLGNHVICCNIYYLLMYVLRLNCETVRLHCHCVVYMCCLFVHDTLLLYKAGSENIYVFLNYDCLISDSNWI